MRKKMIERVKKLKGVICTVALAVAVPGTQPVFAKEMGEALNTAAAVTQTAQQDGQLETGDATSKKNAGKHSGQRKGFFQRFLENHPRVKERVDHNGDGKLDRQERTYARNALLKRYREHHRDYDNNPPGQAGGAGTNWENPAGPQGGPGASPNRFRASRRGHDGNFQRGMGGERGFGQRSMGGRSERGLAQRNFGGNSQGNRGGRGGAHSGR